MQRWRRRGYVEDSEEEEEEEKEEKEQQSSDGQTSREDDLGTDGATPAAVNPVIEPERAEHATGEGSAETENCVLLGQVDEVHGDKTATVRTDELHSEPEVTHESPMQMRATTAKHTTAVGSSVRDDHGNIQSSQPSSPLPAIGVLRGPVPPSDTQRVPGRGSPQMVISSPRTTVGAVSVVNSQIVKEAEDAATRAQRGAAREEWAAPTRNFRQRKPIQLNPYQVLDGRYLREMRRHGVRPTRVIVPSTTGHHHESEDAESDSQSLDQEETQSVYASPPKAQTRSHRQSVAFSPPHHRLGSPAPVSTSSPPSHDFDEEDLPSLDALLRGENRKGRAYMGLKRRKLQHVPQENSITAKFGRIEQSAAMPPSPTLSSPTSQELPTTVVREVFRPPPAPLSPFKPPTPATSSSAKATRLKGYVASAARSSPGIVIPSARWTDKELEFVSDDSEDYEAESDSSSSSSEVEQESGQLKRIRRRIKGVLPASWLKLDVKAQENKPNRKPENSRVGELRDLQGQPGVARRILKSSTSGRTIRDILDVPSDEERDERQLHRPRAPDLRLDQQTTLTQPVRMPSFFPDDDPGDMMEDNAIDLMLPAGSGHRWQKISAPRKRQTRVIEKFGVPAKKRRLASDRKQADRSRKIQRPRFKPPKLSVLDALPSSDEKNARLPDFLKVAKRQAERQQHEGRSSPRGKNIRLQTREDTQDAQSVLADWHAGKIRLKMSRDPKPVQKRSPLMPRDPNVAQSVCPRQPAKSHPATNDRDRSSKHSWTAEANHAILRHPLGKKLRRPMNAGFQEAQLEDEAMNEVIVQDRLQFHHTIDQENQDFRTLQKTALGPDPQTLDELEAQITRRKAHETRKSDVGPETSCTTQATFRPRRRRLRKLKPQQIDVDTAEYRQPEEFVLPAGRCSPSPQLVDVEHQGEILQGLHPWGVQYAIDFDILPLPMGTYFHFTTFVGSCALKNALTFFDRDLAVSCGFHNVSIAGHTFSWGPWSEELASNTRCAISSITSKFSALCKRDVSEGPELWPSLDFSECVTAFEALLDANARWLCFSDPVDRRSCADTYLSELRDLQVVLDTVMILNNQRLKDTTCLSARLLVLTAQIMIILQPETQMIELRSTAHALLQRQAKAVANYVLECGSDEIRTFYDQNRHHAVRESGIKHDQVAVEVFLVLQQTLAKLEIAGLGLWDIINAHLSSWVDTTCQAGSLERGWLSLFSFLPLLEISIDGVSRPGSRFQYRHDNWDGIKTLLSRTLLLYGATTTMPGTTINEYVRMLLLRCHHLIQAWGWRRCESIVSVIFDFFAKREYMSLVEEHKFGSPRFLEQLATQTSLDPKRDDKAFHIFLKVMAIGLRGMRRIYSDKQIRSIVWRWLPNHSRAYDKDKELRKEDLDALRNQHDLLSTLYWASPPSSRPRLQLVQDLVHHTSSHLEACRISIKTWANLTSFQLSTDEASTQAEPLRAWLSEIFEQNVAQYRTARPELEAQHNMAKSKGIATISADKLNIMIARNQSGIIAALTDALAGLRNAVTTSRNLPSAWVVLNGCNLPSVLSLFDAKTRKTEMIIVEALRVFDAAIAVIDEAKASGQVQVSNGESQDYGEWPDEEDAAATPIKDSADQALDFILSQSAHLLSNVFGSEIAPSDDLLTKAIHHWTKLASAAVRHRLATFGTFLGDYGKHAWSQLRDTSQRHKYGPYFFACILEQNQTAFTDRREQIMGMWLCSLVERDAQLKFQHTLTSALLNICPRESLLQNLPFAKANSGAYNVSASELRERRLLLLSTVLSNMRNDYQRAMETDPDSASLLRAEYTTLLNQVMGQMRRNYEELRQGDMVQGAYVHFVHTMIGFMQQYTADIIPIDKYFTDSSAFPLPSNDPTYLVGKLKSYDGKLRDTKMAKQFIVFMQTVSERAAVDGEQEYLVSQLSSVMNGSFEHESPDKTSLRSTLLNVVFPAYIEACLEDGAGWILACPLLQACAHTFQDMLYKFSITNPNSAAAVTSMLTSILSSIIKAISPLEYAPQQLQRPHIVSMLSLSLRVASAMIPCLDYIRRRTGHGNVAAGNMAYLHTLSLYVAKVVLDEPDAFPPINLIEGETSGGSTQLKDFCAQQLRHDTESKWRTDQGRHMLKRGVEWRHVHVELGTIEEEKVALMSSIEDFHAELDRAKSL